MNLRACLGADGTDVPFYPWEDREKDIRKGRGTRRGRHGSGREVR